MPRLRLVALALLMQSALLAQTPPKASDHSQEASFFEKYSDTYKFEDDGTFTRESTAQIRIQSDAGLQAFSILRMPYESAGQSVTIDFIRVHKPDGTTVETPLENVQDMPAAVTREAPFYSDLREKQAAVKALGIGDALEYRVRWQQTKPLAPGQFWLEYSFNRDSIMLEERLEVSVPRARALKLKSEAVKPVIGEEGAYRIYRWNFANLTHKTDLEEKQLGEENLYRAATGHGRMPDIQLSSFQNWDDVGRWYGGLQQDRVKPSAEIQAKAAELTKGLADDDAKIRALYNYVSLQFHYIGVAFGIGRYQPHFAAEVLGNQYGDCKDKHTLLASLLAAAGIKAYPALISARHEIDAEVPYPGQFDHVISVVPQGDKLIWMDTTEEVAPFGYLVPVLRNKHALVIADSKPATLVLTPDSSVPTAQEFRMEAKLSDEGVLEGKAEQTLRGDREILFRTAFRSVPLPQWNQLAQELSNREGFSGEVSGVTTSSPEDTTQAFRLNYSYKRADYSDWGNHQIVPPLPVFALPGLDDNEVKPLFPVWLGTPGEISFHSQVEVPGQYVIQLPPNVHVKTDFADYDATYSEKRHVFTADRKLTIKMKEVPVDSYEEYKKLGKAMENDYRAYTVLSVGSANDEGYLAQIGRLPFSSNPEANRAFGQMQSAMQSHDPKAVVETIKRAVEIDPGFTRAWIVLGQLYLSLRESDLALEADRKAIASNPQSPLGYKVLGYALAGMGKYEESIPVWQKLCAVASNDAEGPGNLGGAYMSLKRYPEAISAYESALKIDADRPVYQFFIGRAYLLQGEDKKADEAFAKAIGQKANPDMVNSVSYELADAGTELPQALQYAQQAVQQEENAAAKVDLSSLSKEDLAHPNRLSAYWDTMGWVEFRLGKFDDAEKYLKAAWNLSPRSVPADHLGQVYAKQHRNADAIRMYRLALASSSSFLPSSGDADIRARLKQAGGSGGGTSQELTQINDLRTVHLPQVVKATANAEFFIVFTPDSKAPGWKVLGVKFISGSSSLKSAGKILSMAKFDVLFPDTGAERILRRGILGCYTYTGCSFVLYDPHSVNSVN